MLPLHDLQRRAATSMQAVRAQPLRCENSGDAVMNYDAYLKTDGVGRNVLEARIRDMVRALRELTEENRRLSLRGHTCGVLGSCNHDAQRPETD